MNNQKKERVSTNPVFIAEVRSPSSVATDFIEKMPEYTALPSLRAYLICSQHEAIAWLFARGEDGAFPELPAKIHGRKAVIALPALRLEIPMTEVYRGIASPQQTDDADA